MTAATDFKTPSDRELLEMAAKAMGYTLAWFDQTAYYLNERGGHSQFMPLIDDGDEARLEAELSMWVHWYPAMVLVGPEVRGHITAVACAEYYDQHNGDKQAARRRAGTRAAAAIGAAK